MRDLVLNAPFLSDADRIAILSGNSMKQRPVPRWFVSRARGSSCYLTTKEPLTLDAAFPNQKSYCTVSFAVRAVSTVCGINHDPFGTYVWLYTSTVSRLSAL